MDKKVRDIYNAMLHKYSYIYSTSDGSAICLNGHVIAYGPLDYSKNILKYDLKGKQ